MPGHWVKNLLNCPGKSPEYVPVFVILCFLPAALLKILNQHCLVQVGLVLKFDLRFLIGVGPSIIVANMNSLACKLDSLGIVLVR